MKIYISRGFIPNILYIIGSLKYSEVFCAQYFVIHDYYVTINVVGNILDVITYSNS
jgi:hypothetical protein